MGGLPAQIATPTVEGVNDAVLALRFKPLYEDGGWRREGVAELEVGMAAPEAVPPTVFPSLLYTIPLPTPILEGVAGGLLSGR